MDDVYVLNPSTGMKTKLFGDLERLFRARRNPAPRTAERELRQERIETLAIFRAVDRVGRRSKELHARMLERHREASASHG